MTSRASRAGWRPSLGQAQPGAQEHPGNRGAEPGQQHERVAQGALVDEDGPGPLVHGLQGLRPQPGHVVRLEQPSFHGEAG